MCSDFVPQFATYLCLHQAAARSQEQAEEFGKVGQMTNIPVTKVAYFQDNRGAVVAIQQHRTLTRPAAGERIFCDSEKGQWK